MESENKNNNNNNNHDNIEESRNYLTSTQKKIFNKNFGKRVAVYFFGLFLMTIGIAFSVKSDLGVSPVSSIPYTITCIWGMEMGKATILFNCVLVLIQMILLRRNFKMINLIQLPIGVIFGYFITLCNWLVTYFPTFYNVIFRLVLVLISTVFVAFGIFFYLPANIMPLSAEGAMKAFSDVTGIAFPKVKIGFDVSMVVISLVLCLVNIKSLGSVGLGTIIAAFLVGTVLGYINKLFGKRRDKWLGVPQIRQREKLRSLEEGVNNNEKDDKNIDKNNDDNDDANNVKVVIKEDSNIDIEDDENDITNYKN